MKCRIIVCSLLSLALSGAGLAQDEKKPAAAPAAGDAKVKVSLETSMGKIVLELDQAKAPAPVANFLKYVFQPPFSLVA